MSLKDNVVYSLNFSRGMLNRVVESMKTPDDWFHQVCSNANHPLWIVGHLGIADARFAGQVSGQQPDVPAGWDELFWFGSEIHSDREKYPPIDEVVSYFHRQRENLMQIIEQTPEEWFEQPGPSEGMFAGAPNMGALLIFTAFHEGMHSGQFTIAHRSLGHAPLLQPQPRDPSPAS